MQSLGGPKYPVQTLLSIELFICKSPPSQRTLRASLGTQLLCLALAKPPQQGRCSLSIQPVLLREAELVWLGSSLEL